MSSTEPEPASGAARGGRLPLIALVVIAALSGCSFSMATVDAKRESATEPACSDGTVLIDRIMGAALVIAGSSTYSANQTQASGVVSGVAVGAGLLYFVAASVGARRYTDCQMARTRWTYSNAIKASSPTPGAARARPSLPPRGNARPWAEGVSEREQALAFEVYSEGNREFAEMRYAPALAKYREAIRHWDHPAIRYNMAVSLINLDQIIEARDNLERSLANGVAALGADTYAQAMAHRTRLDAKLARVTLDCPEPDEEVMLDGKLVFKGPGKIEQFLLPGEHQVVATKMGFLPASRKFVVTAGSSAAFEIRPNVDPRP